VAYELGEPVEWHLFCHAKAKAMPQVLENDARLLCSHGVLCDQIERAHAQKLPAWVFCERNW
jgi:hypothetical protein